MYALFEQHILTDGIRLVYAFKRDNEPNGPDLYYANVASALSLIKTSLYLITTILFDAFIVSSPSYLPILEWLSFVPDLGFVFSSTAASSSGTATSSWFCCPS